MKRGMASLIASRHLVTGYLPREHEKKSLFGVLFHVGPRNKRGHTGSAYGMRACMHRF